MINLIKYIYWTWRLSRAKKKHGVISCHITSWNLETGMSSLGPRKYDWESAKELCRTIESPRMNVTPLDKDL